MTHDTAPRIAYAHDGRRIGYRSFGRGRPAVLLHASPRSAAALIPLGLRLADRFTVFALDSPGFGWSDALPIARPDAADFGDALMHTFDALGISRAPVYGSHTGAAIAVAAGQRHPDRVSGLALDGYAVFTETEQAEYLATYLAPIEPAWDGTHLAFLWSRVKDQFSFFPWYLRGDVARIPRTMPPLAFIQEVIVDFLAAENDYRPAYASAFRYQGAEELRRVRVPTTVLARTDDLLFGHLDKLGPQPDHVRIERLGEDHAEWADAIARALIGPEISDTVVPKPFAVPERLEAIRVPGGVAGVTLFNAAGAGRIIVLLPGIPGSATGESALARALAASRPVLAIDVPGFGISTLAEPFDATAVAAFIRSVLAEVDIEKFDVVAVGESGAIGLALEAERTVLVDPVPDEARVALAEAMVDVTPRSDGTHLLAAWHQLRDMALWRPWTARDPACAIRFGHDPDVPRLEAIMTDWMRGGTQGRATLAAALAPSLSDLLRGQDARLVVTPDHPWSRAFTRSRHANPDARSRACAILELLDAPA
jgi:pimeloyl-ACP methyl ester carboxylesterase